jgi:hypothetical protein
MPKQLHSQSLQDQIDTIVKLMERARTRAGGDSEQWARYAGIMASLQGAQQTALLRELLEKQAGLMPVYVEGRKFRLEDM